MSAPRFIFYSHDEQVGVDSLRRNLAIAAAVTDAAPDASVLLVTGAAETVAHALAPNVDVLTLPGVPSFGTGRHPARRFAMSGPEVGAMRTAQIEAAVRTFRPDVMLVDSHPFGIREELRPALDGLLAHGGRGALGFRDVLGDPATVLEEWWAGGFTEGAETYFERLLVYGDRRVLDFVEEYRLPEALAARTRYCGYVVPSEGMGGTAGLPPPLAPRPSRRPLVLATAGGGEGGAHLLAGFVKAARGAPWYGMVAAEPQLSGSERHALRRIAVEAGVEFHVAAPDISRWLAGADAVVCTGGYGMLTEAISRGIPTLCVPSVSRTREELMRARSLERVGLLQALEPELIDSGILRTTVAGLLAADRPHATGRGHPTLTFDGAGRAARELLGLVAT
jgi:predicted glycosyltransferase